MIYLYLINEGMLFFYYPDICVHYVKETEEQRKRGSVNIRICCQSILRFIENYRYVDSVEPP